MIAVIVVKFQIVTLKKTRIRQNCWTLRHLVKVVTPPLILINKVESTNSDFVDEVGYYDELDTPVGSEDEGVMCLAFADGAKQAFCGVLLGGHNSRIESWSLI